MTAPDGGHGGHGGRTGRTGHEGLALVEALGRRFAAWTHGGPAGGEGR